MTTNLVLGYSDVPLSTVALSSSHTWGDSIRLQDIHNLRAGPRYQLGYVGTAVNATVTNTYDTGTGVTKVSNFLIIARADLLKLDDVTTVTLKGSNDFPTWVTTTTIQTVTLASETLLGPKAQDVVKDFADSAAYRAYKVEYAVTAASQFTHSKLYFGSWLDLGDKVDGISCAKVYPDQDDFYASSGAVHLARGRLPFYRVDVTWKGVTDDLTRDFFSKIVHNAHSYPGVFLFTRNNHEVLDSQRLLHCRLASVEQPEHLDIDYNIIHAVFEEYPSS
jgi:hypothetical protein